jgi:hypothetical protein
MFSKEPLAELLGACENQTDLELEPAANGMGTENIHGEYALLSRAPRSAACIRRTLERGFSSTLHSTRSSTSTVPAILRLPGSIVGRRTVPVSLIR